MSDPNVETGKQAAQAGNFEQAANYMAAAVQTDPGNEEAWLLFGDYLTDPEKRQFCYQRVLEINPANQLAQAGLDSLEDDLPLAPLAPAEPTWLQAEPPNAESSAAPTLRHLSAEISPEDQPTLPPIQEPAVESAPQDEAQSEESSSPNPSTLAQFMPAQPKNASAERQPWRVDPRDEEQNHQQNNEGAAVTLVAIHDWQPGEQSAEQPEEEPAQAPVDEPQQPAAPNQAEWPPVRPDSPVQSAARPARALPVRRKKSPLRFLLIIFPLMLLALIGMLIAPLYWGLILR